MTRRTITHLLRYLALVGIAAVFIGGTAAFTLNQAQNGIETRQVARTAPARPSYMMPLPSLTARDFDVARSVPAVVLGKEAPVTPPARAERQLASIEPTTNANAVLVTIDAANVRSGPSKSTARTFVLRHGDAVEVLSTRDGWSEVRGRSGETGWIWTEFLNR